MAEAESVTLDGQEIRALLGAIMVYHHVPFRDATRPTLSSNERTCIDNAETKLDGARQSVTPSIPRATPGWLDLLHSNEAEIDFTSDERRSLAKVSAACLSELRTDGELSAHVGGVKLAALQRAYEKIAAHIVIGNQVDR